MVCGDVFVLHRSMGRLRSVVQRNFCLRVTAPLWQMGPGESRRRSRAWPQLPLLDGHGVGKERLGKVSMKKTGGWLAQRLLITRTQLRFGVYKI